MLAKLWWRLVAFGFRLLYNEMAFTYDWVSWIVSLGQWRSWQRSVIQFLPAPSAGFVLDLAHGTGNLHLDLLKADYQLAGFDLSPYMGEIASKKVKNAGFEGQFARGLAQKLPFADKSFAAVVSTFPTSFIIDPESLKELNRVLADDGKLIIVLNGILTGGGLVRSFLEWLYKITGQRDDDKPHQDIKAYFDGYGFEVELIDVAYSRSMAQVLICRK